MPIRHFIRAIEFVFPNGRSSFDKWRLTHVSYSKERYRARLIAKLTVLIAQLSNSIPVAEQEAGKAENSVPPLLHSTLKPVIGAPLENRIHPAELDTLGCRYRIAPNKNRLLIWQKNSEADAPRDVARIHTFMPARAIVKVNIGMTA